MANRFSIARTIAPALLLLCTALPSGAATSAVIDQSLMNAKKWLYSKQSDNGSWEVVAAPEKMTDYASSREPKAGQFTGRTALAVLALLNSGESSSDLRIKKAVDFVLKYKTTGVYALGLRCQLWLALPKSQQTQQAMRDDAKILMTSAKQAGNARGMYDYTPGPSKMYSHSRSQYAVLGLWAAGQMGAEIPDQLGNLKLIHLTGAEESKLSDAERDELKQFVTNGGTLVIDAAGGNSRFATSIESRLAEMFPADKLAPIPPSHPLYTAGGGAKDEITYRNFAVHNGVGRTTEPRLQAIMIKDRLAVIYSREDLTVGLVGEPVDGIIGYSPQSATLLMTRILMQSAGPAAATKKK